MKWQGRRRSTNVTDARGKKVAVGTAGLAAILNFVGRRFGFKGILILVALGFVGWQVGLFDPAAIMGGGQVRDVPYEATPEEQRLFEFVTVVLADTEDIWTAEFNRIGEQYFASELVIYRAQYPTGCGMGDARMGPFYCPADRKVYIDLSFYDAMQERTQGRVVPHAFTHGTSEQRMRWFGLGLERGRIEDSDTFKMPYESL